MSQLRRFIKKKKALKGKKKKPGGKASEAEDAAASAGGQSAQVASTADVAVRVCWISKDLDSKTETASPIKS